MGNKETTVAEVVAVADVVEVAEAAEAAEVAQVAQVAQAAAVAEVADHFRENGVKSCSNGALTSPLGEVNAPFETQVSAYSYYIFEQSRNF